MRKILDISIKILINILFMCIGFYFKPTIYLFNTVVHWSLILLSINIFFIILILLYLLFKKIVQAIWKKIIKELKRELNIV